MTAVLESDFEASARKVLRFLHARFGFDLWMLTRTEGEDWIVLQREDHGYGVEPATVFRWADSFCSRMVTGAGPRVAPHSGSVPAYAQAPIGQQVQIGAYIGVPLTFGDGSLFGTLCAIHPAPQPEAILHDLPLIELLACMLSHHLSSELNANQSARKAERATSAAETDSMTGLYNRRGWDRLLEAEEARCSRYGHPACVIFIDLDTLKAVNDSLGHAAGDGLICRASHALREACRVTDVVARVGGDEFVVLGVECNRDTASELLIRLREALRRADIAASFGLAMRIPGKGLRHAWEEADRAMYAEKATSASRKGPLPSRIGGTPAPAGEACLF